MKEALQSESNIATWLVPLFSEQRSFFSNSTPFPSRTSELAQTAEAGATR